MNLLDVEEESYVDPVASVSLKNIVYALFTYTSVSTCVHPKRVSGQLRRCVSLPRFQVCPEMC